MFRTNYKSWMVQVGDFPKNESVSSQLKFLLQFAVLAPSTHNSQPWLFKIVENKIVIQPDFSKALPIGDKQNRFLCISLGCALENLLVAADYYGFSAAITYPVGSDNSIQVDLDKKIKPAEADAESLIFSISKRFTNRHSFSEQLPDAAVLEKINSLNTAHVAVNIITPGFQQDKIRSLVNIATPVVLNDPNFRRELSGYVKTNITSSKIGMPAFVMGVPTLPSLLVPTILKFVNPEKFNKKKQDAATSAQVFIVISSKEDTQESWVKSGQVLERINLLATKAGLYTHPMAAPLHDPQSRQELQAILQIKYKPQFLFRLGYGTKSVRHTPRMLVDDCLLS